MIKYLYNPPYAVKKIFSDFRWQSAVNKILITFDDGPIPETTEIILKILNQNKIKAAFFCVGNNVEKNPSLINSILSEGHLIGNHTYSHKKVTDISKEELLKEIKKTNELLLENHDYKLKYFRAPYGKFNWELSKTLKEKKMINVMWSLITYDFNSDLETYKKIVSRYLKSNSIVVLHDSLKSKEIIVDCIQYLIDKAADENYEIGEPAECLK